MQNKGHKYGGEEVGSLHGEVGAEEGVSFRRNC
jgi:hypothetical protein